MFGYSGLISFVVLALDSYALINIVTSNRHVGNKVLWAMLCLILPVIGFIIWVAVGPRANK
jgi:hypothetical protein